MLIKIALKIVIISEKSINMTNSLNYTFPVTDITV